jgi:hypothetical protein
MASQLREGEEVLSWAWLRIQRFRTGGSTFFSIRLVVEVFDLFRNVLRMKKTKERSVEVGFPLERQMAMCVTHERILIWKASDHPRRVQKYLGEVPRSRVASAQLPFTSHGPWRTVFLKTTDGIRVRLRIDAQSADSFVAVINPS